MEALFYKNFIKKKILFFLHHMLGLFIDKIYKDVYIKFDYLNFFVNNLNFQHLSSTESLIFYIIFKISIIQFIKFFSFRNIVEKMSSAFFF